jgi:hypothetical protein
MRLWPGFVLEGHGYGVALPLLRKYMRNVWVKKRDFPIHPVPTVLTRIFAVSWPCNCSSIKYYHNQLIYQNHILRIRPTNVHPAGNTVDMLGPKQRQLAWIRLIEPILGPKQRQLAWIRLIEPILGPKQRQLAWIRLIESDCWVTKRPRVVKQVCLADLPKVHFVLL